jgi:hypothetical protein
VAGSPSSTNNAVALFALSPQRERIFVVVAPQSHATIAKYSTRFATGRKLVKMSAKIVSSIAQVRPTWDITSLLWTNLTEKVKIILSVIYWMKFTNIPPHLRNSAQAY